MSWIPIKNVATLEKVKQYLEALGVDKAGDLPAGSEPDPGDIQLYVGNLELTIEPRVPDGEIHDESGNGLSWDPLKRDGQSVCQTNSISSSSLYIHTMDTSTLPPLPNSPSPSPNVNRVGTRSHTKAKTAPAIKNGNKADSVQPMDVDPPSSEAAPPAPAPKTMSSVLDAAGSAASTLIDSEPPVDTAAALRAKEAARAKYNAGIIADRIRQQEAARSDVMKQPIPRVNAAADAGADKTAPPSAAAETTPAKRASEDDGFLLGRAKPRGPAQFAHRRIVPMTWEIRGRRLVIPIYARNDPEEYLFSYRIPLTILVEYMRFSDGITATGIRHDVVEVPSGYAEFVEILQRADFGKHMCPIDLATGKVRPIPDEQRIDRTFWVRQILDISSGAAAHRYMDEVEGKVPEPTNEELLLREVTAIEAMQGRLSNARRQQAFEANRAKRREGKGNQ
uniref:Expressed protein n=3 Tax=Schizophyllum commune (strain H4-8 / FGSC 9210) TaxID=578458 RepID=D8PZJ5_SCHCM